jgi:predicted SAM-dependent methyltransferase
VVLRLNIGCGSIRPEGWLNVDREDWDVRYRAYVCDLGLGPHVRPNCATASELADYAVCSFMLQELNHHEIPGAVENMMAILKPGGTLRVLVPNVMRAFHYYNTDQEAWFPQDERTGGLAAKFCTYITWFGTVRSVFNPPYLRAMLEPHGHVWQATFRETRTQHEGIVELDSRENEAMIMEVTKR